MKDSLRLCLSCYACEPNRGSEPGVGWTWALGMAKRHETWVLTRENNRGVIEDEINRLHVPPDETPRFVWVDLPRWIRWLKKRHLLPVSLYYFLWQFAARHAWNRMGICVDVIHHVTFNSFIIPGVWWHRREKVVLGPLGGMSICSRQYLKCFSRPSRWTEFARGLTRQLWWIDYFFRKSLTSADYVFFTSERMRNQIPYPSATSSVLLETAIPFSLEHSSYQAPSHLRDRRFIWAGTLAGHKAGDIAIRSFALAFGGEHTPPLLELFGEGPDQSKWKLLAKQLGVAAAVRFCGRVSQEDLWRKMMSSMALVFTSVRDTSGNVALEALALGTPVVCFNHQGVADIVDDSCGIRITPRSYDEAVSDFAEAMRRLANEPRLADYLGANGRQRVLENFTWKRKFDIVDNVYRSILNSDKQKRTTVCKRILSFQSKSNTHHTE